MTNDGSANASAMLRHVVLFEFASEVTENHINEVVRRFAELPTLVPDIEAFEWGVNCSTEGLSGGLTHCFMLSFNSEAARDAYLPHAAFAVWVGPKVKTVTVVDYWSGVSPP